MSVVEGLPFAEAKKKYILEVLDPILEEMVSDVLTEMPKSPLDFMIDWLRKRSGGGPSVKMSVQQRNAMLKQELKQIAGSLAEAGRAIAGSKPADEEEEEEEDDDDEEDIPETFKKPQEQMHRARQSVSAEAYGNWNQKKDFKAPRHAKTEEQKARLNETLQKSFMFSELDEEDMETVLMAMSEVTFEAGKKVIVEGEDGDHLFVIEKGSLDCSKMVGGEEKVVKTCAVGDVFGELALLYNCPRAASVVAKENCVCWQLDRESFTHIVKDAAVKRRDKYESFLRNVALISSIDPYERSQIADALKSETFKKGEVVVKQSEPGDKFYIVEEGELYATKSKPGEGEKRVMDYKAGDYFGELALMKNEPRAASVVVSSDTAKVLSMSRISFNKMLGPLQHILERALASYT